MDKVKNSPSIDLDKPVSRQHEQRFSRYYGFGIAGIGAYASMIPADSESTNGPAEDSASDVHLRSDEEVRGYHVEGSDGTIGHIEDFIVDDETWRVRYLVVNTRNWWFGKSVLVAPQWASRVSWMESTVHVDLSRDAIKNSPEWNASAAVNREYEARLYDYYGRPTYWAGATQQAAALPQPPESQAR